MNHFEALSKEQRELCVSAGVIRRAAKRCGLTRATVSRTLSGDIKDPNPKAVRALMAECERALREDKRVEQRIADFGKVANQ